MSGDAGGVSSEPCSRSPRFAIRRLLTPPLFGTCLLTAYLSPLVSSLSSQSPGGPAEFEAVRDSLSAISDTAALRTLLRASRAHEKAHKSAVLRSGALFLRLGELGADPDFGDARATFRQAARRDPGQPEPWFGLGLAEASRAGWEMGNPLNLGSRVGLKALERSAADYHHALEADATYAPAALALADVALQLRDTTMLADAARALRIATKTVARGAPELMLAWGRVERAAGMGERALGAFERYLSLGGNRALALLELARTRLALGHPDGEGPYYEGASLDDPVAVAAYHSDLKPLVGDSVLSELDGLSGPARAAYLKRFWTDRDRLELRRDGERLREHYRRLQYARIHFPLTISRRFYGRLDAYRAGNGEVDDRGVIYVRHGEPAQRLRPFVFGAMPNESWRYTQAEGDLLLHFSGGYDGNGGGDLYDYRLVESVLDLRGAADAPKDQLLLSRQSLSPAYSRMLNWGRYGAGRAQAQERGIGRASIAIGTTTDTYELQFSRRLGVVADLIAVGRRAEGSLAHFVFGIAATALSSSSRGGEVSYPVRVRLVALDAADHAVATLDTSMTISLPRQLRSGEYLVGRAELLLPPGDWAYRASLQQGDSAGVVLPRDSVRAAPGNGTSLSLSDLALGSRGRAVPWVTDGADTVRLAPSALFRRNAEIEVYYEVTGGTVGAHYRHEITIFRDRERSSRKRSPLVALSFEEAAAAPVIRSHRTARLDRLKEGDYIVEVRITGPDRNSQVRSRPIRLIDR